MSIKYKIKSLVRDAIKSYDFDDVISEAIDKMDIEGIVHKKLGEKVEELDFEDIIEDLLDDYITAELDEIDIDDEVLEALQKEFD